MRYPYRTSKFKRDYKLMVKRHAQIEKLDSVIADLVQERPLSPLRRDHALSGDFAGCRDCHVEGDWILIYRLDPLSASDRAQGGPVESVTFIRTGTHSDIFD